MHGTKKNKIVSIKHRLKDKQRKQREQLYRNRIQTLRRIAQCASCTIKCAMCGQHLQAGETRNAFQSLQIKLPLCNSCQSEYEDFLKITRGEKSSRAPWHNKEWCKLWTAWLEYQQAIRDFKRTKGFKDIPGETCE